MGDTSKPLFNIYYHHFMGSDADTMHDHPWWSISFILKGGYDEHTPLKMHSTGTCIGIEDINYKGQGSITFRRALDAHWIEIDKPVHTLFITGPKVRSWGFLCDKGWVHWKDYVVKRGNNRHGNGCGEVDAELSQELKTRLGIGE